MSNGAGKLSLSAYYRLTKPGIIRGNAMAAAGGFLLGANGDIRFWLFFWLMLGTSLVIASACAFNNYIDRGIDRKMERTKDRALVTGKIPVRHALLFASLLGIAGFAILLYKTNWLATAAGAIGFVDYVVLYGITKRTSVHGTLIGGISGSMPLVAGYVAASGRADLCALLLFLIMMCWQMPHFYAIAIYRLKDYTATGLPIRPAVKGIGNTKRQIIAYTAAFGIASTGIWVTGYTGYTYAIVMSSLCVIWLYLGVRRNKAADANAWAESMFRYSLIVLSVFSVLIAANAYIP